MSEQHQIKTVYLVRHGRTNANGKFSFQPPDEPLSDIGRKQAEFVAIRLQEEGIDRLASSSYPRALETAGIIGRKLGLSVTELDSVIELRRPKSLYNRSYFSPRVLSYIWRLIFHREDSTWHYEGAENIFMVRQRIEKAKEEIIELPGNKIVVVSHRFFMALFVIAVCARGPLKISNIFRQLFVFFKAKNTTVFKFTVDTGAPNNTCHWVFEGVIAS